MFKRLYFILLLAISSLGSIAQVDFRKETIYFLLPTRFFDGDPTNNRPNEWCSYRTDGANPTITDPNDVTWRGDFKGLIQKLDYIQDLGFTAIWITPIVQNRGPLDYHGYHAWDFTKVDPRLESPGATFQDLINAVHARGMKIVLDIVTNHSGRFGIKGLAELKYNTDPLQPWGKNSAGLPLQDNPSWAYDGMTPNPQDGKIWSRANLAKMPAPFNANLALYNWPSTQSFVSTSDPNWFHQSGNGFVQGWDDTTNLYQRAIAGDCPDLNTGSKTVRDYFINAYGRYIAMGVDAFRWDTMKHMNKTDALAMLDAWKAMNPNLFVFAEVAQKRHELHPVEETNPHWYTWRGGVGNSANSNMAVIDFYAEATFHNTFEDGQNFSGVQAAARYDHLYSDPSTLVTWLDNHDFGPNNDWNRRYGGSDQNLAACMNFMFTWRGIPTVYYGTESRFKAGEYADIHDAAGIEKSINLTGRAYYGDAMAAAPNHIIYQHIKKLNAMRKAIPALQNGSWNWAGNPNGNGVGYVRKSGSSEVAVGLAKDGAVTFNFTGLTNGTYRDAVTGNAISVGNGNLSFVVQPGSAGIYVLNGPGMIGANGAGFFQQGSGGTSPVVTIAPNQGNYLSPIQVSLSQTGGTGTTNIYYTLNGTIPTASSTLYTGPFTVSTNTTVRSIAIAGNGTSAVTTNMYTFGAIPSFHVHFKAPSGWLAPRRIYSWAAQPTGALADAVWPGNNMVAEANGWFGYTFTGITSTNLIFNDGTNQTVDLNRVKNGWYTGGTWSDTNPDGGVNTAPTVSVSPVGPATISGTSINLNITSTDNSGIAPTLYYTTNGTTPTTASPSASGSIALNLSSSFTLRVYAVDNLGLASAIQTHAYTLVVPNAAPVVSVDKANNFMSTTAFNAVLTGTDDSGVAPTLYYTTDGSNPTTASASAVGTKTLNIATSTTLKVFAVDNRGLASTVQTYNYIVNIGQDFTVYFEKPASWSTNIRIHYWNSLPAGSLTATNWPGVATVSDGGNWYKFTFNNINSTNLIFNDNGSTTNKTIDLSRNKTGYYSNGVWSDTDPRVVVTTSGMTVRFFNAASWANPRIYIWNVGATALSTATAPIAWPGAAMVSEGNGWFRYTIAGGCSRIIFSNNGASQTADLSRCGDGWFKNNAWTSTQPAREGLIEEPSESLSFDQNIPNPFAQTTTLKFTLPTSAEVDLLVQGTFSQKAVVFSGKAMEAGAHQFEFDRGALPSGVYVFILKVGDKSLFKKFIIE